MAHLLANNAGKWQQRSGNFLRAALHVHYRRNIEMREIA
jgi:hypothetical protein